MTLARLWQSDRDGLQGAFLQPIARLLARKTTQRAARVRLITDRRELCRGSLIVNKWLACYLKEHSRASGPVQRPPGASLVAWVGFKVMAGFLSRKQNH